MMKKTFTILLSLVLGLGSVFGEAVPSGETFLRPLQTRDSVLIADQLLYGVKLEGITPDVRVALPDMSPVFGDTLVLVEGWKADTLNVHRHKRQVTSFDLELALTLAPFEEGHYFLPDLYVLREDSSSSDTLLFRGLEMDVCTIPIDTATFVPHDLKPQIRYPLTLAELKPYIAAAQVLAMIVIAVVCLVGRRRRKEGEEASGPKEPAYIVALRNLDKYRGDKFWAAEKQKTMYSGITDALRTYIEDRFEVNAEEMTTAEIFSSLKGNQDLPKDLYEEVKYLFELSDFVKFAKHTASDEENAKAVPVAVKFVTSTYQSELEKETVEKEAPSKDVL